MICHVSKGRPVSAFKLSHVCIIASSLMTSACTMLVAVPTRPEIELRKTGLTWSAAYDYLERARTNMQEGQSGLDSFNTATVGSVGVGTGGAAVATLSRSSTDAVLGLLTLSGIGYSINQVSNPEVQLAIYKAGLKRLTCVEEVGKRLNTATSITRESLTQNAGELQSYLTMLFKHLAEGQGQMAVTPKDIDLAGQIRIAQTWVIAAQSQQRAISAYMQSTDVPFKAYLAVDRVVTELNDQLRARAPKPDDVAKLGDNINAFKKARQFETTSTATTAGEKPAVPVQAKHEEIADTIHTDTVRLAQIIARIQSLLPAAGYETTDALEACFTNLPVQGYFIARPDGPINLNPGGDSYTLTIDTDASAIDLSFAGATPSAQNLLVSNPGGTVYSLAAPAGAKADDYVMFFRRKGEAQSLGPNFHVQVAPAVSTRIVRPPPPPGVTPKPASLKLADKLVLLGLIAPGTAIHDEKNPNFIARVQKLEGCPGFPPGNGTLNNALVAKLKNSKPVSPDGACPAPLNIAAPSGGAGTLTPKPPNIKPPAPAVAPSAPVSAAGK